MANWGGQGGPPLHEVPRILPPTAAEIVVLSSQLELPFESPPVDAAELAAVTYLARYNGRTLEAYRADLRGFFQWAAKVSLEAKLPMSDAIVYASARQHRALLITSVAHFNGLPKELPAIIKTVNGGALAE